MSWNGEERRRGIIEREEIRIILARIEERVNNLISMGVNFRSEIDDHKKDDDLKFKEIGERLWNHAKLIYIGIGAVAILELIGFFHK